MQPIPCWYKLDEISLNEIKAALLHHLSEINKGHSPALPTDRPLTIFLSQDDAIKLANLVHSFMLYIPILGKGIYVLKIDWSNNIKKNNEIFFS